MKGKITNSLKPPLTKRPFALGYWELWDKENLQATLNVYSKCLWMHTRERVGQKISHKVHRYQMDGPLWKWNQNKWLHWLLLKSPFSEKHISTKEFFASKNIFLLIVYTFILFWFTPKSPYPLPENLGQPLEWLVPKDIIFDRNTRGQTSQN